MEKRITFIGPNSNSLFFEESLLSMNLIEVLWEKCNEVHSKKSFNALLHQLKMIEEQNSLTEQNPEFSRFIQQLSTEFPAESEIDSTKRLLAFKASMTKSFTTLMDSGNEKFRFLLFSYLLEMDYIFSYNARIFLEPSSQLATHFSFCSDRQAFMLNETTSKSIFYPFYGSLNQSEKMAVTRQEKSDSKINLRLALSKITQFEEVSIVLIGFNEEDAELRIILDEVALNKKSIKLVQLDVDAKTSQLSQQQEIDSKTGLEIERITASLEDYLTGKVAEVETKAKVDIEKQQQPKTNEKRKQKLSKATPILTESTILFRSEKNKECAQRFTRMNYLLSISVVGLASLFIGFNLFFSVATIKGESMAPSFRSSDYIMLNKRYSQVNRFDVIAFKSPDEPKQEYIKRVIGLPGDAIEYSEDHLYINGNLVEESYLDREKKKLGAGEIYTKDFSLEALTGVKEVPKNKLFVLGDNRLYSRDGRNFGFIDVKDIKGDVKFKIWPME